MYSTDNELNQLIKQLGQGKTDSVAYDTAWIARLHARYPSTGSARTIRWLLDRQHSDGSWGSDVSHYHDHLTCTLAAILGLAENDRASYQQSIENGLSYLQNNAGKLVNDRNDTIAFRGVSNLLLEDARTIGLQVPDQIPYKNDSSGKLQFLKQHPEQWPTHPIVHSLECFRVGLPAVTNCLAKNGLIGASPAASAAVLLNSEQSEPAILAALEKLQQTDGGYPTLSTIDLFEIVWSIDMLKNSGQLNHEQRQALKIPLDYVWQHWTTTQGLGASSQLACTDLDDTAAAYGVLNWAGYPVNLDVFEHYEKNDHFETFPNETDPSLSAHLRLLAVLKIQPPSARRSRWIAKILTFLHEYTSEWTDKWHASPLYLWTLAATILHNLDEPLADRHLQAILNNQNADGGWGYYQSSSEETAYALQALNQRMNCPTDIREAGYRYLDEHHSDQPPALWIGKCLYHPPLVVQAAIWAARPLALYNEQKTT